jgi:UPF0755 protein
MSPELKGAQPMRKPVSIAVIAFLALTGSAACAFYLYGVTPPAMQPSSEIVVVPRGSSVTAVARLLESNHIIRYPRLFTVLAKLSGAEYAIKSGEYRFPRPLSPRRVLGMLVAGEIVTHPVTIPEGSTLTDIARLVEAAGLARATDILDAAADPDRFARFGLAAESLEGFLFPDTYRFSRNTPAEDILAAMLVNFFSVMHQERAAAPGSALSDREVVILASLVEKETARADERTLVAAVFLNRLAKGMRLECDPTVVYGILREQPDFTGRLRKTHLREPTPYNTYRIPGLPPGPICSPGRLSIRAVLSPAEVDYLFFVSRNDGSHVFSRTLREHNRAVNTYQRRRPATP